MWVLGVFGFGGRVCGMFGVVLIKWVYVKCFLRGWVGIVSYCVGMGWLFCCGCVRVKI